MSKSKQAGATVVELAIIMVVFLTLLLGIMDFGRLLFTWNSATEATALGARLAVVCNKDDTAIEKRMLQIFPQAAGKINVTWGTGDEFVTVSINDANKDLFVPISPWLGFTAIQLPAFSTSLPRESMDSANPDCNL